MKRNLLLMILASGLVLHATAQDRLLTGQILDAETKGPLPGATITTTSGTKSQSDTNGKFKLSVLSGKQTELTVQFVGYNIKKVKINTETNVVILLQPSSIGLNEVVAIGYGSVKRGDVTGAISSLSSKQIQDVPITSAEEILTGRLAGLQVTKEEGSPDAEVRIKVRGGTSITEDNSPLYIIDGIPMENGLRGLSPQDILSVNVLKDASSTAIYGARGANGVVVVTTRGGKEMKTQVSYNGSYGFNRLAKKLEVLNPYEFLTLQWERDKGYVDGKLPVYGTWADIQSYKGQTGIDWQEKMLANDGRQDNHNLSILGGTKNTQFSLSLSGNNQKMIVLNSGYKRQTLNFRFNHTITSKLKGYFNVRYSNQKIMGAGTSNESSASSNNLRHIIKYRPMLIGDVGEDDFDYEYLVETENGNGLTVSNPVATSNGQYSKNIDKMLNLSGYIDYSISNALTFRSTWGYGTYNQNKDVFWDWFTNLGRYYGDFTPVLLLNSINQSSYNISNTLTYDKRFAKHKLNFLLGNEFYGAATETDALQMKNYAVGITAEKALAQVGIGVPRAGFPRNDTYKNTLLSFFSRVNYAFNDKYLFTATLRADGSSKFSAANRWGYFPSASIAWKFSSENFLKSFSPLTEGKLRVSYGAAGNNRIQDYLYLQTYTSAGRYNLNETDVNGSYPASLANKNLKWETTISRNIGLDLSFLKNRLQLTADIYRNSTRDLLVAAPIATNSGYKTQLQNIGETLNKGLELQISGTLIDHKAFKWNMDFNVAFNKNKIVRLANSQSTDERFSGVGIANSPADYLIKVGESVGTMYGWVNDGFYKVDDFDWVGTTYTLKSGQPDVGKLFGTTAKPGMIKFRDLTGEGQVSLDDRTIIGNANPKYLGGINNQFSYKNFDLSVFLNFSVGNDIFNANKIEFTNAMVQGTNLLGIMKDRWRNIDGAGNPITDPVLLAEANQNAKIWTPHTGTGSFYVNSWAIEDGSFLRVNNVTLGYSLPSRLLKSIFVNKVRVYFTANNLHVFTRYSGFDPEVSNRGGGVIAGVDYSAFPRSKAYIFGLNVTL
ncbi:TonB-linked SusC/RagA family outer membrane protein [Pedobacter africanus]|uniref:TonB-linked SusC/RagA family outer membrane protein n=1 Tax=Pedobacter africanus TaxID=151894 RepID=A0ACC6KS88_9SPHI|nr:TonB-dependent receptor [Pedobacter africanus]MDR6781983.1 TonB-linked SusC/RagA family outer membrane protein [Pedobacter africanus]